LNADENELLRCELLIEGLLTKRK